MEPVGTTYQSAKTDRPVMRRSWRISLRSAARFSGVNPMTNGIFAQRVPHGPAALFSRYAPLHRPPRGLGSPRRASRARDLAVSIRRGLRGRDHDSRVHVDLPENGPAGLRHAHGDVRSRPPMRRVEISEGV